MIVDFLKLFPKACEIKGISAFIVNTNDIKFCLRRITDGIGFVSEQTAEDVVQIGHTTYKFPAVDNGIMLLHAIALSENIVKLFEQNKELDIQPNKYSVLEVKAAMESLNQMAIKYG